MKSKEVIKVKLCTIKVKLCTINYIFFKINLMAQGKGRYTLDIFARDIAIKRYCDKKTFLNHVFQYLGL